MITMRDRDPLSETDRPPWVMGWTAPDGIDCARMRSLQISNKGDRPWNRLAGSLGRSWLPIRPPMIWTSPHRSGALANAVAISLRHRVGRDADRQDRGRN
jgi:hypothetical protein